MRLLLFLFLTLAVWAAPSEPVEVVHQFEQAWSQARSWQDVQGYFSAATARALKKLTPAQQAQTFQQARAEQLVAGTGWLPEPLRIAMTTRPRVIRLKP